jgi:hypothetical protein
MKGGRLTDVHPQLSQLYAQHSLGALHHMRVASTTLFCSVAAAEWGAAVDRKVAKADADVQQIPYLLLFSLDEMMV